MGLQRMNNNYHNDAYVFIQQIREKLVFLTTVVLIMAKYLNINILPNMDSCNHSDHPSCNDFCRMIHVCHVIRNHGNRESTSCHTCSLCHTCHT